MRWLFHRTVLLHLFAVMTQLSSGAVITGIKSECGRNQSTVNFLWTYNLSANETLRRINWDRITSTVTNILEVDKTGAPFEYPGYEGRVNTTATPTNGQAHFQLSMVSEEDIGMYRCTVTTTGGSNVSTADLEPPEPANVSGILVEVTNVTRTSANVMWRDPPKTGACAEMSIYHVHYQMNTLPWQERVGTVNGSAYGNETLNFTVTGLTQGGNYTFGITASNSVGTSTSRAVSAPVNIDGVLFIIHVVILVVVGVFYSQALWAAVVMFAILGADAYGKCDAVKHLGFIGPLVGVFLSVAVIVTSAVPPNSGHVDQQGFVAIVVVTAVADGMGIGATIAGFLFKKSGKGVCVSEMNFSVAVMAIEFCLGLVIAIAGTVISAVVYVKGSNEYKAGIAIGAVSIALLVAAFIWFMVRVCGKRQSSRDLSGPHGHPMEEKGGPQPQ